jgi:hypothetical protein
LVRSAGTTRPGAERIGVDDERALLGLRVVGDRADAGRAGDLLGLAGRAHPVVEGGAQHRDADAEGEADEHPRARFSGTLGLDGFSAAARR